MCEKHTHVFHQGADSGVMNAETGVNKRRSRAADAAPMPGKKGFSFPRTAQAITREWSFALNQGEAVS